MTVRVRKSGSAPPAGSIAIVTNRTTLQVAPDSVRFMVDLSQANFDSTETFSAVTGKTHNNAYDPRLHDIIYLWDMGDNGTWSAPLNVMTEWKSKRYAKGPFVGHCYTEPGDYTVKLTAIEPSSGKWLRAEDITITVHDPNDVYQNTDTICISSSGNFAGAPAGAQQITASQLKKEDQIWIDNQGGNPKRWLFRTDETFAVAVKLTSLETVGYSFGNYGGGARPICTNDNTGNSGRYFDIENTHAPDGTVPDVRIYGLNAQGGFDPSVKTVTQAGNDGDPVANRFISSSEALDLVCSDCRVSGVRSVNFSFNHNDTEDTVDQHIHFDDIYVTSFGGQYVIITEASLGSKSSFTATGVAIVQDPNACSDDTLLRAPIRSNGMFYTHGRGCDLFHTGEEGQPCWKIEERPLKVADQYPDGHVINVHSCTFEGGFPASIRINGNMTIYDRGCIQNAVIDGNILLQNYQSEGCVGVYGQGITVRNNIGIKLQGTTDGVANRALGFISLSHSDATLPAEDVAPIDVYNNTLYVNSTSAEAQDFATVWFRYLGTSGSGRYTDTTETNNIRYIPQISPPEDADEPLSTDVLISPRCIGRTPQSTFTLDPTFAPVGDVLQLVPQPTSPALDAATDPLRAMKGVRFNDDLSVFFTGTPSIAYVDDTGYIEGA